MLAGRGPDRITEGKVESGADHSITRGEQVNRLLAMILAAGLIGCSMNLGPMTASDKYKCTAPHGGDPRRCWQDLDLDRERPATGASYHSAGTMVLASATCVRPDSQFWFHGAHHPTLGFISAEGNAALRSAYNQRYPALTRYLDSRGALNTTAWTKLRGSDLARFGVPMCGA